MPSSNTATEHEETVRRSHLGWCPSESSSGEGDGGSLRTEEQLLWDMESLCVVGDTAADLGSPHFGGKGVALYGEGEEILSHSTVTAAVAAVKTWPQDLYFLHCFVM